MAVMNMDIAMQCVRECVLEDVPVMIWGPPGVGKSQGVLQVAESLSTPTDKWGFIDFRLALRDPADFGLPMVNAKTQKTDWLVCSDLPDEKRDGKHGILFLDEINLASQLMQGSAFGLVLDRKLRDYKLPEGWRIVAAGNRAGVDRSSVQKMPAPLSDRFEHFEVEPEVAAWVKWATGAGIHPAVIAFIRFRPALLFAMPTTAEQRAFCTPRSWAAVSKFADKLPPMRQHLVAGKVGEAAALEFEGFMRVWKSMPSIPQILKDPTGVHVPDMSEPAALYAVSTALARHCDASNAKNAMEYAKRLPREFEVLMATDMIKRDPALKKTKAFCDFAVRNAEVVL